MSAPDLPRYVVRSVSGWPINEFTLNSSPWRTKRKLPVIWQIQDSWEQWRVVMVVEGLPGITAQSLAEVECAHLNEEHEEKLLGMPYP